MDKSPSPVLGPPPPYESLHDIVAEYGDGEVPFMILSFIVCWCMYRDIVGHQFRWMSFDTNGLNQSRASPNLGKSPVSHIMIGIYDFQHYPVAWVDFMSFGTGSWLSSIDLVAIIHRKGEFWDSTSTFLFFSQGHWCHPYLNLFVDH